MFVKGLLVMAKTRTAASKSATIPATPDLSIPNPVRDAAPVKSAGGAASALSALSKLVGTKKPTAAKAKPTHPRLPLTPEAKEKVRTWIPAKILFDHFETYKKNVEGEMDELVKDLFYRGWWDNRSFPDYPTLNVESDDGRADMEAMFVFQERFRVQIPESDDPNSAMVDLLVSTGLTKAHATNLVERELVIAEEKTINLTGLLSGRKVGKTWVNPSPIEQSAATKLIALITGQSTEPMNEAEIHALILTTDYKCTVKPGFLERAVGYCESFDQLKNMVELVFHPVVSHKSAKYGISEALEARNQRIIGEAAAILGVALGVEPEEEE